MIWNFVILVGDDGWRRGEIHGWEDVVDLHVHAHGHAIQTVGLGELDGGIKSRKAIAKRLLEAQVGGGRRDLVGDRGEGRHGRRVHGRGCHVGNALVGVEQ